ncbi:hypothetical protein EXIGLDRAFT_727620 [Exidia glandulosa HHB12029]|uniref:BTB domain-containing protein n=1 Tax=Exidia glandulosa HHB12029 TaxID=1314781 RepID=A0A165LZ68_EXIGL|nr:hypothetical protein EXIGLDRAFT_727620 [Exidia glandulosa HHB12029]
MALPVSASPSPRSASPMPERVPTIDLAASATQNYTTDEFVRLDVGGHSFTVAKSRLTMRSLKFQELFELPEATSAGGDANAIVLHNDPDEFKDFIWFIHADHISFLDFQASSPSKEKCTRLLGIASIAHFYEADAIADWAMNDALQLLTSNAPPQPRNDAYWAPGYPAPFQQPQVAAFQLDADLVMRLLRTASRWSDTSDVARCARDIVLDAMNPERYGTPPVDPVEALQAALELNDTSLAAHAYFYTHRRGCRRGRQIHACAQSIGGISYAERWRFGSVSCQWVNSRYLSRDTARLFMLRVSFRIGGSGRRRYTRAFNISAMTFPSFLVAPGQTWLTRRRQREPLCVRRLWHKLCT